MWIIRFVLLLLFSNIDRLSTVSRDEGLARSVCYTNHDWFSFRKIVEKETRLLRSKSSLKSFSTSFEEEATERRGDSATPADHEMPRKSVRRHRCRDSGQQFHVFVLLCMHVHTRLAWGMKFQLARLLSPHRCLCEFRYNISRLSARSFSSESYWDVLLHGETMSDTVNRKSSWILRDIFVHKSHPRFITSLYLRNKSMRYESLQKFEA